MTNLECVVAVLASHREARQWSDEAVAADLLKRLGVDAAGAVRVTAPGPAPIVSTIAVQRPAPVVGVTGATGATGRA